MEMSTWRRHLEVVTNVVVIGTCLILCTIVAMRALDAPSEPSLAAAPVGSTLTPSADVSFGGSEFTVLLGFSTTCRFCRDSLPALKRLHEQLNLAPNGRLRVMALTVEPVHLLSDYLNQNELPKFQSFTVRSQSELVPIIRQTPTVVLVDRTGRVVGSWVGLITEERVNEILVRVAERSS